MMFDCSSEALQESAFIRLAYIYIAAKLAGLIKVTVSCDDSLK